MIDHDPTTDIAAPPAAAATIAPHATVGMEVRYVAHECHAFDKDHRRRLLFKMVHTRDAPNTKHHYKRGNVVTEFQSLGGVRARIGNKVHTKDGHILEIIGPHQSWKATVREVFEDGTVALDIEHPHGGITLHYPDHGKTTGLPYDPAGAPHTWHLPADEKKGA